MENDTLETPRWPWLERRAVAVPFLVAGVALLALLVAHWTGWPRPVPIAHAVLVRLAVAATLSCFVMGSRRFRDAFTAVMSTIVLAVVYTLGVGIVWLCSAFGRQDFLDLRKPRPSLWHVREPRSDEETTRGLLRQF